MTGNAIDSYLAELEQAAHAAGIAEEAYRQDAITRIKALEVERAFAFRRLNLMRAVAASFTDAKDEAEAEARGAAALLRELNWGGGSEPQREVVERFRPVVMALWQMREVDAEGGEKVAAGRALAAFEQWFAENRNGPFLSLMERDVVELPLVEV